MNNVEKTNINSEQAGEDSSEVLTGWESVATLADQMEEPTAENTEQESVQNDAELEWNPESKKIREMRETWGDFEAAQNVGIFGKETNMNDYDYGVLAESMSWEDFSKLADQAYDLGFESYEKYRDFLVREGSRLYKENDLSEWDQLGLAVRRYNIAKHVGETNKNAKWSVEMSMEDASYGFSSLSPDMMVGNDVAQLSLDKDGRLSDIMSRGDKTGKVNVVFDRDLMDNDKFDVYGGKIAMPNVPKKEAKLVIVDDAASVMAMKKQNGLDYMGDVPVYTKQEWQTGDTSDEAYNREVSRLINEAVANVDKQEVREFVNERLEKVDPAKLTELMSIMKTDRRKGAEAAVEYFSEILGFRTPELRIAGKDGVKIADTEVSGSAGGATEDDFRLTIQEKDLKRKPRDAMNTIAHEMFHFSQRLLIYRWRMGQLQDPEEIKRAELYNFCHMNYEVAFTSYKLYRHQLVEEEAFAFGNGVEKKIKQSRKGLFSFFNRRK